MIYIIEAADAPDVVTKIAALARKHADMIRNTDPAFQLRIDVVRAVALEEFAGMLGNVKLRMPTADTGIDTDATGVVSADNEHRQDWTNGTRDLTFDRRELEELQAAMSHYIKIRDRKRRLETDDVVAARVALLRGIETAIMAALESYGHLPGLTGLTTNTDNGP